MNRRTYRILVLTPAITIALCVVLALLLTTEFASAASYQLSGHVLDESGNPIADTVIEVIDRISGGTVVSTTTDANGNYALSVAEGIYHVRVTPPAGTGFGVSTALNQQIAGNRTLNFTLVPATSAVRLQGRVLDAQGQPMGDEMGNECAASKVGDP